MSGWLLWAFGSWLTPLRLGLTVCPRVGSKALVNKLSYLPIKRGDIIVFHFPVGDTVIDLPEFRSLRPCYDVIRELGRGNADSGRQIVLADPNDYPLTIRSVYRRETWRQSPRVAGLAVLGYGAGGPSDRESIGDPVMGN